VEVRRCRLEPEEAEVNRSTIFVGSDVSKAQLDGAVSHEKESRGWLPTKKGSRGSLDCPSPFSGRWW
jgi:hypothetical protein